MSLFRLRSSLSLSNALWTSTPSPPKKMETPSSPKLSSFLSLTATSPGFDVLSSASLLTLSSFARLAARSRAVVLGTISSNGFHRTSAERTRGLGSEHGLSSSSTSASPSAATV
mgnify:CR=1 FL=1